jgi:hypothetical protein
MGLSGLILLCGAEEIKRYGRFVASTFVTTVKAAVRFEAIERP